MNILLYVIVGLMALMGGGSTIAIVGYLVAILTCMLTMKIKLHEAWKIEGEKERRIKRAAAHCCVFRLLRRIVRMNNNKYKVLLVEDDENIIILLTTMFETAGQRRSCFKKKTA